MPGEAIPETASAREVPTPSAPSTASAGVSHNARADAPDPTLVVVQWIPPLAADWVEFMRKGTEMAMGDMRNSMQRMAKSDAAGEALQLAECASLWAQQLPIVKKFEDVPAASLCPLLNIGLFMGYFEVCFTPLLPAMQLSFWSGPSVVFHTAFVLAAWAFHEGVVTHPGGVPDSWRGEPHDKPLFAISNPEAFQPLERKKQGGGYRYCKFEHKFKPDRAHYCKISRHNVVRMDHYCPWLGNCVGLKNHKFFFLTIFYDSVAVNVANVCMIHALSAGGHSAITTFLLANTVLTASVVSMLITPFAVLHCYLLCKNRTTIEYCEVANDKKDKYKGESPYDLGIWHNLSTTLGTEWYFWLLPTKPDIGDGLDFEVQPRFRHEKSKLPPGKIASTVSPVAPRKESKEAIVTHARSSLASLGAALVEATDVENDDDQEQSGTAGGGFFDAPPATSSLPARADAARSSGVSSSDAGEHERLSRKAARKCAWARDGRRCPADTTAAERALSGATLAASGALEVASTVGRQAIGKLWERRDELHIPEFVYGGLLACEECGRDLAAFSKDRGESFYAFSLQSAQNLASWLTPQPEAEAPRLSSTVWHN